MSDQTAKRPDKNEIDMVAFAREATLRDQASTYAGSIKLIAPAKVNLHLAIGARRPDGYHDVVNVMHTLMLHDVLYMRTRSQLDFLVGPDAALAGRMEDSVESNDLQIRVISIGCEGVEAPSIPQEENLVYKAIMALAARTGCGTGQCVEVRLEKHIPAQAGLAGGSSDAAAALLGAAHIWGIPADDPAIVETAQELGSDVPFFLQGGCARYVGRGEQLDAALTPTKRSLVLIKPETGLSTAAVYRAFDEIGEAMPADIAATVATAQSAEEVSLSNNLDRPARSLLPELDEMFAWAAEQSAVTDTLLCGSGSTVAVFCTTFEEACRLSALAMQHGWWTRTTTLTNLRAAVVPR